VPDGFAAPLVRELMTLSVSMASFSSLSTKSKVSLQIIGIVLKREGEYTQLGIRVGGVGINGILDGLVVALHGDLVLAAAALVVVVDVVAGCDAGGGLFALRLELVVGHVDEDGG